jgi:hypothetical protein
MLSQVIAVNTLVNIVGLSREVGLREVAVVSRNEAS